MATLSRPKLQLETYLPLPEAAKRAGIPVRLLIERINSGTIKAIQVNGEIAVSQADARQAVPKEELPEYKKHAHLKGVGIWIAEAGRKYGLQTSTLTRWVKQGYIRKLRQQGNKQIVDEADVAYCHEVYLTRGGQGKWLFNLDGTPYSPKR